MTQPKNLTAALDRDPQLLPPGVLPRRYGGDKLAFKPARAVASTGEPGQERPGGELAGDDRLILAIGAVINEYRDGKRKTKALIEAAKERGIAEAKDVIGKKRVLRWYHSWVLLNAGWFWEDPPFRPELEVSGLKRLLLDRLSPNISIEEARQGTESGCAFIRSAKSSQVLYTVYFGRSRFPAEPSVKPALDKLPPRVQETLGPRDYRNVYVKIGHEADVEDRRLRKEFVLDSNGVMTHRYVTRAFLVYNLATMFGLRLIPPGSEPFPHQDDAEVFPHLLPKAANRICRSTMRVADPEIEADGTLAAQVPRYTSDAFGGHADVFDIRYAAAYEPDGLLNPDFTPYRTRGSMGSEFLERTGLTVVTGFCADRARSDPMKRNERASMQVRNGSGPVQPYLSTAALMEDYKVIRANKGERFDEGAENQGTVLIDLAIAKLMGVEIINQHAVESDRFKIAYHRYYDAGDAIQIERAVAVRLVNAIKAGKLEQALPEWARVRLNSERTDEWSELLSDVKTERVGTLERAAGLLAECGVRPRDIGVDDKALDGLPHEAYRCVMALRSVDFDFKSKIKRPAALELEEYIASARKNREILMDRIPIECIVRIKLNPDEGKWQDVKKDSALGQALAKAREAKKVEAVKGAEGTKGAKGESAEAKGERGPWVDFDAKFRQELGEYLAAKECHNLKEMFKRAVRAKREEDLQGLNKG